MTILEDYRLFEFDEPFEDLVGSLWFGEYEEGRLRFTCEATA
jgi:hypothetical protein